jgi:hypothetical protein
MAHEIAFAESVQEHFRVLTARERATVLDAIGRQLSHQPLDETRHRKPYGPTPSRRGSYVSVSFECSTRLSARIPEWFGFWRSGEKCATH